MACSQHHRSSKRTNKHHLQALEPQGTEEAASRVTPKKRKGVSSSEPVGLSDKMICITCGEAFTTGQAHLHSKHEITTVAQEKTKAQRNVSAVVEDKRRTLDILRAKDIQRQAVVEAVGARFRKWRQSLEDLERRWLEQQSLSATEEEHVLQAHAQKLAQAADKWQGVRDMALQLELMEEHDLESLPRFLAILSRASSEGAEAARLDEIKISSLRLVPDAGAEDLHAMLRDHLRLEHRYVHPARCVAEGPGLQKIFTGSSATFKVRAHSSDGPCASGGDTISVEVFACIDMPRGGAAGAGAGASRAPRADAAGQHQLDCQVRCTDHGDGSYTCSYSVPEDALSQVGRAVRVVVRINGMTICASDGLPSFDVEVVEGCRLDFDPSRPFEGVLFHLGSNGGGEEWENPHSARMVKVSTVPGLQCGSLAAFVSGPNYHDKGNFTKEQDVGKAARCTLRTRTHTHTRARTHTHAYTHTYTHTCMHSHMHAYMHAWMHAWMHTYIHTCMHAYMHTCIHMYVYLHVYVCMYIYIYIYMYIHYVHQGARRRQSPQTHILKTEERVRCGA